MTKLSLALLAALLVSGTARDAAASDAEKAPSSVEDGVKRSDSASGSRSGSRSSGASSGSGSGSRSSGASSGSRSGSRSSGASSGSGSGSRGSGASSGSRSGGRSGAATSPGSGSGSRSGSATSPGSGSRSRSAGGASPGSRSGSRSGNATSPGNRSGSRSGSATTPGTRGGSPGAASAPGNRSGTSTRSGTTTSGQPVQVRGAERSRPPSATPPRGTPPRATPPRGTPPRVNRPRPTPPHVNRPVHRPSAPVYRPSRPVYRPGYRPAPLHIVRPIQSWTVIRPWPIFMPSYPVIVNSPPVVVTSSPQVVVRPSPPVVVNDAPLLTFSGRFEGIDVIFSGTHQGEIYDQCADFVSGSTAFDWVDDLVIGNQMFHRSLGWWSPQALCVIAASNVVSPWASMIAQGEIEGTPFILTGNSTAEIQDLCEWFVEGALSEEWIDDISVNGVSRHNSTGWWDTAEACMIVSANAQPF